MKEAILKRTLAFGVVLVWLAQQAPRPSIAAGSERQVHVDKTIEAISPTECEEVFGLELSVTGTSDGPPIDVVLILDRSGSMDDGGNACTIPEAENPLDCEQAGGIWGPQPITSSKEGAKLFVDLLRPQDRAALVSYADTATLDLELTFDHAQVHEAIDALTPDGSTNTADALDQATAELLEAARPEAAKILILMSDGVANRSLHPCDDCGSYPCVSTCCTDDAILLAGVAKDVGYDVFSIFLRNVAQADEGCTIEDVEALGEVTMISISSGEGYFYVPETPDELALVYEFIASKISPSAYDLTITDEIAPEFEIVEGSIVPDPDEIVDNTIVWRLDVLGNETRIFSYEIARASLQTPPGTYPTSVSAVLDYIDPVTGLPLSVGFPTTYAELSGESCFEPAIDVEKLVSTDGILWLDADHPTGPEVIVDRDVFFRFVVTNAGNVDLAELDLVDDLLDLTGWCDPPDLLMPGESFECLVGPLAAEQGQHANTATATATAEGSPVEDSDPAHYLGVHDCTGRNAAILVKGSGAIGTQLKFKLAGPPGGEFTLYMDTGAGPIVVPDLGSLCLDNGTDATVIASGQLNYKGYKAVWWTIPDDPELIGVRLVFQMVAFEPEPPNTPAISNTIVLEITDGSGPSCEGGIYEVGYFTAVYYDGSMPVTVDARAYSGANPEETVGELTFVFDPDDPPVLPITSADQGLTIDKLEAFTGVVLIHAYARGCNFDGHRLPDLTTLETTLGDVTVARDVETTCDGPLKAGDRYPPIFITEVVDVASAPPGGCD